jgi:DNA-binding NarL/FixJ family response regulator
MFQPLEPRTRVLIVDGDRRVRRSLSGLLEASDLVEVIGCASTAVEMIDMVLEACPDAVLIDLDRPDAEDWLDLIATFRCACPSAAIVVLGEARSLRDVALKAGADAFLNKPEVTETLAEAVVAISQPVTRGGANHIPGFEEEIP